MTTKLLRTPWPARLQVASETDIMTKMREIQNEKHKKGIDEQWLQMLKFAHLPRHASDINTTRAIIFLTGSIVADPYWRDSQKSCSCVFRCLTCAGQFVDHCARHCCMHMTCAPVNVIKSMSW
jgi:hypothetical protein